MADVEIKGVDRLTKRLRDMARRHKPLSQAVVAYSAEYSVKVHEDLQAFHDDGQAKFLEFATRTTAKEVTLEIRDQLADGKTMEEALLSGGAIILEASNALVPVNTGFLRDSGYVDAR